MGFPHNQGWQGRRESIPPHYRGRIAVHFSLKPSRSWGVIHPHTLDPLLMAAAEQAWMENHDAGHIIGTVELVDCVQDSDSPWAFKDHWHWVLANPQPFDVPVPAKGKLGLWEWTPEGES